MFHVNKMFKNYIGYIEDLFSDIGGTRKETFNTVVLLSNSLLDKVREIVCLPPPPL